MFIQTKVTFRNETSIPLSHGSYWVEPRVGGFLREAKGLWPSWTYYILPKSAKVETSPNRYFYLCGCSMLPLLNPKTIAKLLLCLPLRSMTKQSPFHPTRRRLSRLTRLQTPVAQPSGYFPVQTYPQKPSSKTTKKVSYHLSGPTKDSQTAILLSVCNSYNKLKVNPPHHT